MRKLRYDGKGDPNNQFEFNGMPHAYGMIPRTFEDPLHKEVVTTTRIGQLIEEQVEIGGDRDPLDIYILSERDLPIGQCKCKVIGVIHFVDGDEIDYKIIAVDQAFVDVDQIRELSDLKNTLVFQNALEEILNWLKYYKTVDNDGNKLPQPKFDSKIGRVIKGRSTSSEEARKVIRECRGDYDKIVRDQDKQKSHQEYEEITWISPSNVTA